MNELPTTATTETIEKVSTWTRFLSSSEGLHAIFVVLVAVLGLIFFIVAINFVLTQMDKEIFIPMKGVKYDKELGKEVPNGFTIGGKKPKKEKPVEQPPKPEKKKLTQSELRGNLEDVLKFQREFDVNASKQVQSSISSVINSIKRNYQSRLHRKGENPEAAALDTLVEIMQAAAFKEDVIADIIDKIEEILDLRNAEVDGQRSVSKERKLSSAIEKVLELKNTELESRNLDYEEFNYVKEVDAKEIITQVLRELMQLLEEEVREKNNNIDNIVNKILQSEE